jgi:2-keto-4-pentenoate hydratase
MMFGYCVQESGDLPCARIIRCWQAAFDVEAVLKKHLTALHWKQFNCAQPKDKVISLIEIIEAAKAKK